MCDGACVVRVFMNVNAYLSAKVRRLYDIANILTSINFLEKCVSYEDATKKAAYKWIGLDLKAINCEEGKYIIMQFFYHIFQRKWNHKFQNFYWKPSVVYFFIFMAYLMKLQILNFPSLVRCIHMHMHLCTCICAQHLLVLLYPLKSTCNLQWSVNLVASLHISKYAS